ncbi:MAG TPA: PASTA domain-containing protein [Longimicrobiaceae bacterium]|nr:PASTA domain-containing protein [Longimicrobiaceae bacterium]
MSRPTALAGWRKRAIRPQPEPKPRRGWRERIPERVKRPFGERRLLNRVLWVMLGSFVLGYLFVTLLFFPGFGRSPIVTVPNLRGQGFAAAERRLERLGLEAERGPVLPHPDIRRGAVLTQDPLPGQEVTRGSTIRLLLSAGPERRAVPSIAGLPLEEARALLERMGFTVATRQVIHDSPVGRILELTPAAGRQVALPETVTITLSAGPPKVLVPSVLALPEPEARARLQEAGLRLGTITYDPFSAEALGGIASQSPAPGDSLRKGGSVRVVISGSDPNPPPPVEPDSVEPEPEPEPEPPAEPEPPRRR